jgi:type IV secretory pathway component VirB8
LLFCTENVTMNFEESAKNNVFEEMPHINIEVAKKIDSGEYYQDARDWYFAKYVSAHGYFALAVAAFAILAYLSYLIINIATFEYQAKKIPFPVYFGEGTEKYLQIRPIRNGLTNINFSVADYLLRQYVMERESFKPGFLRQGAWEHKVSIIRGLSSRQVFNQYANYVDIRKNPDSPVIEFKKRAVREVEIDRIDFMDETNIPNKAVVYFSTYDRYRDNVIKTQNKIYVEFVLSNLSKVSNGQTPLQFKVTRYYVTKIEN